jgi:hypothetical protein
MASPFETYTVHYQSGSNTEAFIQLFHSGSFIGQITFFRDGTPSPGNVFTAAGLHFLSYPLSRFSDVLRILQYEKPLSIIIDRASGVGKIVTSFEPVGEQEGV